MLLFSGREKLQPGNNLHEFTTREIHNMTNNFGESNRLAKGAAGTVYIGELDDGSLVAVKRSRLPESCANFEAEMDILSNLRSPNLVALLGYCRTPRKLVLVSEYMPLGDLADHLLDHQWMGLPILPWRTRLSIALDCAKGLNYLHNHVNPPVIHRDVKPSNILLDRGFVAKLADFGHSATLERGATHATTLVRGTAGYIDPEYFVSGRMTLSSDVFSFGVVLLQLISGRETNDRSRPAQHGCTILAAARDVAKEVLDFESFPDAEMKTCPQKILQPLFELAMACTNRSNVARPSIQLTTHILNNLVTVSRQQFPT